MLVSENFVSKVMTVDELPRSLPDVERFGKAAGAVAVEGVFMPPNDTAEVILSTLLPYIEDVFDTAALHGRRHLLY